MESYLPLRKGVTPRRQHADLDGLKDDELGRYGFVGRTVSFYRRNDPTKFTSRGPLAASVFLAPTLTPTDLNDAGGGPVDLYSNPDCRLALSRRALPMPFYVRNVDGDELWFVHRGTGRFETEFGPLSYRPGHYVYLPKSTTYRHVPDDGDNLLLLIETTEELRRPDPGLLGRNHPFDASLADLPEPATYDGPHTIRLTHQRSHPDQHTWLEYAHDPCDVEGWRGDNVPFAFHIDDYDVLMSESVHLPPTVHLFLQAQGVAVMNFLPRAAETRPGVERPPWYHRNADYDEIAFFHGGRMFGVELPPGLMTHAPQGVHHGVPEEGREIARATFDDVDRVEWSIIAVDTRARLVPSAAVRAAAGLADATEEAQA